MAYLSLYRKYRPQRFAEILGQEHVSTTLSNAIVEDRVAHAYLFTGPRGTGKTSTARILAKALNCEKGPTPDPCGTCPSCVAITNGSSLDVIEMDAASHSKVEETREVLTGVALATAGGRKKIYVIDEVHMLTAQSFNALLKTLEEPPDHVVFVLATTEAHKVLPTIVSRTQRFDFRRVSADTIETHLAEVAKLENIDIEPDAITSIARRAEGSVRDALSSLDQLRSFGGRVSMEDADDMLGDRDDKALGQVFDAIALGDVGAVLTGIHALVAQGSDPRQLALGSMDRARSLLLLRVSPASSTLIDITQEDLTDLGTQSESFTETHLLRILDLLATAVVEMRNAPNHRLLLEVALVRASAPDTDPSAGGLLGRLERIERRLGIEGANPLVETAPAGAQVPAPVKAPQPPAQPAARQQASVQTPAQEPTAPPSQQPAPTSADVVGLGHIRDAWQATMKEVNNLTRRVGAFLNPSRALDYDGETVTVEVQSAFHRDAMSEAANLEILREGLNAALGIKPKVVFVERGAEPPTVDQTPSDAPVADLAEATEVEVDAIELVKQGLGAEVVEEIEDR